MRLNCFSTSNFYLRISTKIESLLTAQSRTAFEPRSVADELGKLVELRDRGIITNAEFQAQKAKLLQ
jgi:hypothetical protein